MSGAEKEKESTCTARLTQFKHSLKFGILLDIEFEVTLLIRAN